MRFPLDARDPVVPPATMAGIRAAERFGNEMQVSTRLYARAHDAAAMADLD